MGINVRVMTPEDKPGIMRILANTPEFKPSEVVVAEEVIDSYLASPRDAGYCTLVADIGSLIAGYVCFGSTPLTEGTWDLYWIAVASDKQGLGIGGTLLEMAEKNMSEEKARLVIIETSSLPAYEKTRRFYLNRGYKIIGRIPDFYTPGDDKLILQKRLQ